MIIKTRNEDGTWKWRADVLNERQRKALKAAESYGRGRSGAGGDVWEAG